MQFKVMSPEVMETQVDVFDRCDSGDPKVKNESCVVTFSRELNRFSLENKSDLGNEHLCKHMIIDIFNSVAVSLH